MFPKLARRGVEAGLFVLALALGAASAIGHWDESTADTIRFGAWCAALALLFLLGLLLPLRLRGAAYRSILANAAIIGAAIAIVVVANIALYRHDVHFDLTRVGRYTAPPELETIAASLAQDVALVYFYNPADNNALGGEGGARRLGAPPPASACTCDRPRQGPGGGPPLRCPHLQHVRRREREDGASRSRTRSICGRLRLRCCGR